MSTKQKNRVSDVRRRELRSRARAARRRLALTETAGSGLRRIIRLPELEAMVGRGRTSILADIDAGRFPRPVALGGRAKGWLLSEIENWLRARAAERDQHVEAAE